MVGSGAAGGIVANVLVNQGLTENCFFSLQS
jgi:choline dehydrogenase-like flavoprotein